MTIPMGAPRRTPRTQPPSTRGAAKGLESVRLASSLPSGVFQARTPQVEQAIAGGVAGVFLRHMARFDGPADVSHGERNLTAPGADRDPVTAEDVDALLAALRAADTDEPTLRDGVGAERAWVLVHLAMRGNDTARRSAAIELLQTVARVASRDAPEAAPLHALRRLLAAEPQLATKPMLAAVASATSALLGPENAT